MGAPVETMVVVAFPTASNVMSGQPGTSCTVPVAVMAGGVTLVESTVVRTFL